MRPAPAEDTYVGLERSAPARFAIIAAAVAVIALFFLPGWVLDVAQTSVASLFPPTDAFGLRP
jgi:hypothetical protein